MEIPCIDGITISVILAGRPGNHLGGLCGAARIEKSEPEENSETTNS